MKSVAEMKSPEYLKIYEGIRDAIVGGIYKSGDRLPSKRSVADKNGVSVITAEHAYALLCDEGYAEARERSGYFVIYKENDFFPVEHGRRTESVRHDGGYPIQEDFPFSVFAKTMRRVLSEHGEKILEKCPNNGCVELREAIAGYLARSRGIRVSSDQIIIGSGAEYLYGLIVQLLGRNRIYAVEDPSYEKIEKVYKANGVRCDLLRLGNDGIESIELIRTNATVLHISPYRSFPSGVTASASKRREYLSWALGRGGVIVEDDFESEFSVSSKPEDTVFSLSPDGGVIYVNTFSKTIAPAIRAGYMVIPKNMEELFRERVGFYSCTVPVFDQYVLADFIGSGDFERHINRIRRRKRKLRDAKR